MNLSKQQLDILNHAIAVRCEALRSEAQTHVLQLYDDEFSTLAGAVGDAADQATAELIRNGDSTAIERDVKELREFEAARSRLASDEYGVCIDCGQDIGFERLIVQPSAARCLFCQEMFERMHPHPEGGTL